MTHLEKPSDQVLFDTMKACASNAERLKAESFDLEFREPPALQLYVLLIAQEEYAKAFILHLIRTGVIPFSRTILRSMNDHTCKQLVGLIIDYIVMRWDTLEELKAMVQADADIGDYVPSEIESAIALLRFEKVGRWESRAWEWEERPTYEPSARHVAEGKKDRRKQDALYVRIGADGRVIPATRVTDAEIWEERERVRDYFSLVTTLLEGKEASHRYDKAIGVIKELFTRRLAGVGDTTPEL